MSFPRLAPEAGASDTGGGFRDSARLDRKRGGPSPFSSRLAVSVGITVAPVPLQRGTGATFEFVRTIVRLPARAVCILMKGASDVVNRRRTPTYVSVAPRERD